MAHILIAEDDKSMCEFLSLALENAGHSVKSFNDGLDAFNHLKDNTTFDLLLTDVVMPGMDGIELSKSATALQPGLKVMFITGFAAVALSQAEPEINAGHVMSKPFHLNDLVNQVDKILSS
jgi:two-component system cell cycle response regulator CpdR